MTGTLRFTRPTFNCDDVGRVKERSDIPASVNPSVGWVKLPRPAYDHYS
jgi:hypothetical protein